MDKKIAIFLNQHMPMSEVFIAHQIGAYTKYKADIIACRQVTPSVQHNIPFSILNRNNSRKEKIAELLFKLTGRNKVIENKLKGHDIIHAHFGPSGYMVAPLAKKLGIPLVFTLHGYDILKDTVTVKKDGILQFLYHRNIKRLIKQADLFICVSEYVRQKAIKLGFPAEKCIVHYMGIPLTPLQPRPARSLDAPFRILSVGRLIPYKGHHLLIEALSRVEKEGYQVQLDIVGGGPEKENLEFLASQKLKNYKIWGSQPHSQIISLMNECDAFSLLSHTQPNGQTEAFGLVFTEAQWAGLPVIAFHSGGIGEAVADGQTALLCPEGDIEAVKNAIIRLITDNEFYSSLSRNGPAFVQEKFDSQKNTAVLEKMYDSLIEQRSRA